ncbi:alpha/beta fold hydrolase [Verminephrobacter eiseniae]|uniref:alpha/beta fold hydrolase n=1 Tax=Verminephrobacter eiseniae TaxID=364317 RepID=UPI0022383C16|nr:alpha/beta hydrolase [Verminephrobacter eiseniae]MCW5238560.1 alpha/beta hydrolase [Verminephrobacter eiseniae]
MIEPRLNRVLCPGPASPATPATSGADAPAPAGMHRMAYWEWRGWGAWNDTGHPAHSRVVVCVHGLARQGRDFDNLARALSPHARVICPDVAGRGQSDWLADPMAYQIPQYVSDMLALLAQLQQSGPISTLDWVGTSMGGLIGLVIAGQPGLPLPVPVRRLVLNDIGPVVQWQALQRIAQYLGRWGQFDSLQQAADALWSVSSSFGPHTPAQWLELSRAMVRPLPQGGLALHYDPALAVPFRAAYSTPESVTAGEAALWRLYDQITARTLLLRGMQSDLLAPATAQAMAGRGPRAHVVEFEGVGHAPMLMAADQLAAVTQFLLAQ